MSHYLIIVPTTKITRESSCAVGWNWYMYSSAKWHNAWPIWGKGFNRKGKTASTCLTPIFLVTMVLDILCHYTRTFTNSHIFGNRLRMQIKTSASAPRKYPTDLQQDIDDIGRLCK